MNKIDTKKNKPEILNGKGDGEDIPPGEKGRAAQVCRPSDRVAFGTMNLALKQLIRQGFGCA